MSQDRAFATVHLLTSGQRNVCTLAMWEFDRSEVLIVGLGFEANRLKCILNCCFRIQKLPRLMVATADGQLFIYNMDPMDGGECTLAHKHRWGNRVGVDVSLIRWRERKISALWSNLLIHPTMFQCPWPYSKHTSNLWILGRFFFFFTCKIGTNHLKDTSLLSDVCFKGKLCKERPESFL